jgi:hypothetical protein
MKRRNPGTQARATSTTPIADSHPTAAIASQQTSWWSVHTFVAEVLDQVADWPMAGTPAWCALDDDDPAKWAALFDAAQHFILRVETCQEARCDASRDVADAVDWSALAREILVRTEFYAARPYLRRVAS